MSLSRSMFERLWDREFAKQVDLLSSEQFKVPTLTLMENAGHAVFRHLKQTKQNLDFLILAGPGNNGGDALVAARLLLKSHTGMVHVILVFPEGKKISANCQHQIDLIKKEFPDQKLKNYSSGSITRLNLTAPVIVDGLLGIGFSGKLDKPIFDALSEANTVSNRFVLAIDVPSGLDCDLLSEQNIPLIPEVTVTFGGFKPAHLVSPARQLCGRVLCEEIGFAKAAVAEAQKTVPNYISHAHTKLWLKEDPWQNLSREAHKYDRGHILILGGSPGKTGAPLLSALASLRCGAGWASVALVKCNLERQDVPLELTFESFFQGSTADLIGFAQFLDARKVQSLVVGPGTMTQPLDESSIKILAEMQKRTGLFLVFDAGALAGLIDLMENAKIKFDHRRTLLTPHPGEWRKLSLKEELPAPLSKEALKNARSRFQRLGVSAVYKHATPIFIDAEGEAYFCDDGSHILARAGSGDVLAGLIAAHGAMNQTSCNAFFRSQGLMTKSSEMAAAQLGANAVLATDIIQFLGQAAGI